MKEWLAVSISLVTLATAVGALCGSLVQKGYRLGRWIALLSEQVLSNSERLKVLEDRLDAGSDNEVRADREDRLSAEVNRASKNDVF